MIFSHHPHRPPKQRRRHTRAQQGYVLVMFALLLIPILFVAGLSIDVGYWYNRASDMRKAADAAALAGVVWLPNESDARSAALLAAERNGFKNGVDGVTISVTTSTVSPRRIRVQITDTQVSSFLWKNLGGRDIDLTRTAFAEYVLAVPMGSPKNILGTGNLFAAPHRENFWLAASGYCASSENGDKKLAGTQQNYPDSTWRSVSVSGLGTRWYQGYRCYSGAAGAASASPTYDPRGYIYAIDVPVAGSYPVRIYDATYSTRTLTGTSSCTTNTVSLAGDSGNVWTYPSNGGGASNCGQIIDATRINTIFTLRGADSTPFTWSDNPVLSTQTVGTNDSLKRNQWWTMYTITAPGPGTYYLQVQTSPYAGTNDTSWGSNSFGLNVGPSSPCTTIVGQTGYSANCPNVHGYEDMGILANLSGTSAEFYFADVGAEHAGKTFQIKLFDPGEGASALRFIDPSGNVVNFNWEAPCASPWPNFSCSGTNVNVLNLSSNNSYRGPNRTSNWNFSDREVTLRIQIPADYDGGWWKVRYTVGSSPTDRTTWSAQILGDPIHLVEEF